MLWCDLSYTPPISSLAKTCIVSPEFQLADERVEVSALKPENAFLVGITDQVVAFDPWYFTSTKYLNMADGNQAPVGLFYAQLPHTVKLHLETFVSVIIVVAQNKRH